MWTVPNACFAKDASYPKNVASHWTPGLCLSQLGNTALGNIVVLTYLQFNFSSGFSCPQFTAVQNPYMANSKSKQFQLGL